MNKVALITGAGSGIGKELAKLFLSKKYCLILSGRNKADFDYIKNKPDIDIVAGDLTDKKTIERLTSIVKNKYNRLDILINNAGITFIQPFEENTNEDLDKIIETNLIAPVLLTQSIYNIMKSNNKGTIVFVNSAAGMQGYIDHTLYSMTKFGLRGFSQSLREEAKLHNIRVLSVHPGGVKTSLYNKLKLKPDTSKYMNAKYVAEIIVYLAETSGLSPDEISISRLSK